MFMLPVVLSACQRTTSNPKHQQPNFIMAALEHYLQTYRECVAAQKEAERLVKQVHTLGRELESWAYVRFAGNTYPSETLYSSRSEVTASDYPSYEDLTKAIEHYHLAKMACSKAWKALPEADQQGLQKPPEVRYR